MAPRKKKKPKPVGPVFEDGSYGVKGGKVYDPDTGKVRKKAKTYRAGRGGKAKAQ